MMQQAYLEGSEGQGDAIIYSDSVRVRWQPPWTQGVAAYANKLNSSRSNIRPPRHRLNQRCSILTSNRTRYAHASSAGAGGCRPLP